MLGQLSNEQFIEYCYKKILGRNPDIEGKYYHLNKLLNGYSRFEIIDAFITSNEHKNKLQNPFLNFALPGDFNSPFPDTKRLEELYYMSLANSEKVLGIDLHEDEQIMLLKSFSPFLACLPWFKIDKKWLYRQDNDFFSIADAAILYCFIQRYKPRRIIEIGSGFSSAAIIDCCDYLNMNNTELTFIEPFPQRLKDLVGSEVREMLIVQNVEDIKIEVFEKLGENDILFIDSSHVVKLNSDVLYIITVILPQLKNGVIIHFHDVFWPFEYPLDWLLEGRAWNEAYYLRSFLMHNNQFKILFFNDLINRKNKYILENNLTINIDNYGCSIWLQKYDCLDA